MRERIERLTAAHERARHDLLDSGVDEGFGDALRLAVSGRRQRTEVVVGPLAAAPRLAVANEVDGHRASSGSAARRRRSGTYESSLSASRRVHQRRSSISWFGANSWPTASGS